jgi:hypothetical protein
MRVQRWESPFGCAFGCVFKLGQPVEDGRFSHFARLLHHSLAESILLCVPYAAHGRRARSSDRGPHVARLLELPRAPTG